METRSAFLNSASRERMSEPAKVTLSPAMPSALGCWTKNDCVPSHMRGDLRRKDVAEYNRLEVRGWRGRGLDFDYDRGWAWVVAQEIAVRGRACHRGLPIRSLLRRVVEFFRSIVPRTLLALHA